MDKMTALTMFVAAADHGSFSRAAEHLGKTPSAITKAIAQLESELGTLLFERTTRRMALTEAGQIYLEGARQALMQLQLAGEEVDQLQHALRGSLRITAPPAFGPAFLSQVCSRFMAEYPQVRLEVDLNDNNDDLVDGGYDLALRDGPTDLPELIAQPLLENRVMLCASPAYLARKGMDVTLDNYAQHDWLILRHPQLSRSFWWVESEGQSIRLRQPVPRLASDNYDLLLTCLLEGQGVQFVPHWSAAPYLERGELVELMAGLWRAQSAFGPWVHVLYLPHRRNTRKVRVFIDALKAYLQDARLAAI
ncbi:LysR family transcriptional regulator [Pseudomonas wadenswilerensis]|uniref:LysR family transcriptional regulator n=1 Tax=Pseudomonas wadenswilerensis TaxID=1785161 RepID=UPI00215F27E4|nr:LysR family transcriptional regulator [Pseudomonas wadenswilerensis]UVM20031.1 LysR family transcriptional regulator [Pseudomonas wadenswilerensis]